jgi:hypothetical protein
MTANHSDNDTSISKLILVPSLISLAITLLRLVGELQHWPTSLFSPAAGGGGSIVGISWLVPIFGIYFAMKLVGAGKTSPSAAKPILLALLGIAVFFAGAIVLGKFGPSPIALLGFGLFLLAALLQSAGWKDLFKVLLAYAFAARIPVLIVMFLAIRGDWHTHYDVVPPNFPEGVGFWTKFLEIGFLPQMTLWIGFTVIIGTLTGSLVAIFLRRDKKVAQPA